MVGARRAGARGAGRRPRRHGAQPRPAHPGHRAARHRPRELQWFVAAYTLVFAAAMLPAGLLGDRFGRKKLLLIALVLFGGARSPAPTRPRRARSSPPVPCSASAARSSCRCASPSLPALFIRGGAAAGRRRVWPPTCLGFPIGPILGGWLLSHFWWGSVFLINVPVVVLALVAACVLAAGVAQPRRRTAARRPGVLTSSVGLAALTYGVIEAGQHGWGDVTGALGAALVRARACVAAASWSGSAPRAEQPAAGRPGAVPLARLHLGHAAPHGGDLRHVRRAVRRAAVLPGDPRRRRPWARGLRLLPMIGGLLARSRRCADRLAAAPAPGRGWLSGSRCWPARLLAGATTSAGSGYGLAAAWMHRGRPGAGVRAAGRDGRGARRAVARRRAAWAPR